MTSDEGASAKAQLPAGNDHGADHGGDRGAGRGVQPLLPEALICGYERAGTTLLSDILRANGWESGFECGVLLSDRPRDFRGRAPYWQRLARGWRISPEARDSLPVDDITTFYNALIRCAFPNAPPALRYFDKTPAYMAELGLVLSRAPFVRKTLILHRDPRAIFVAHARRQAPGVPAASVIKAGFKSYVRRYLAYFTGCAAYRLLSEVMFVPFEDLCLREQDWLSAIGGFLGGAPFVPRSTPSRFGNVSGTGMDHDQVHAFRDHIDPSLEQRILDATRLAAPFFMSAEERHHYGDLWDWTQAQAQEVLDRHGRMPLGEVADGAAFDPLTYLLRYPDVLACGVDPVRHFERHGRDEGRRAM